MPPFQMNPFLQAAMMRQGAPFQAAPSGQFQPSPFQAQPPVAPQFGQPPLGGSRPFQPAPPFGGSQPFQPVQQLPAGQVPMPPMGGAGMPAGMGMPQNPGAPFNPFATRMGAPPGVYGPFGGGGMQNGGMPTSYTPGATGAPGSPGAYPGSQFMSPEEAQQKQLLGNSGLLNFGGGGSY